MDDKPSQEGGWAATPLPEMPPHDLIPLLPGGTAVFESLPARAVVLTPLAPAVGDGVILARRPDGVGVVLIRGGAIAEAYHVTSRQRTTGSPALQRIHDSSDAVVSAWRLEPDVVDVIPTLLRADAHYNDLRLEWVDWELLLSDLRTRRATYVVELITLEGRGVVSLCNGQAVASFTDTHPGVCDMSVVDELAEVGAGTVRVLREDAQAAAADDVVHDAPEDPEIAMIGAAPMEYRSMPQTANGETGGGDQGAAAAAADALETRGTVRSLLGLGQQEP